MGSTDSLTAYPRISIVTPSFNQGKYREKTILSEIEQEIRSLTIYYRRRQNRESVEA